MYEIITIPFNPVTKIFNSDDLNAFCINKKVISTKIEFFKDERQAYWTVFIEYEPVLEKNSNEPAGLTEAERLCYEKLREWRKETAEKEGIPPYVIAKNSHLLDAEWDDRYNRKVSRLIAGAGFRYKAGIEEIDYGK